MVALQVMGKQELEGYLSVGRNQLRFQVLQGMLIEYFGIDVL